MACRLDRCGAFRRPTAISTQQAAHFGTQTPAAYSQRGARLIIMACRLDRCGAFRRPTAMSTQQAVHFGTQTPAAYSQRGARLIIMACRLDRCGAFRRPTAISTQQAVHFGTQTPAAYSQRGARLIIMACRLDRCGAFRRPTAISTQQAVHFGTQTPAAGFAPPTRHARPLIFSPHATYRRLISSYKFLLSPSLFPVAAPIGPPLRAVGHLPAGIGAVCSSFLSAPRRRGSNGPFFHLQVLPVLAAPPAPFRHPPPWRCPVRRSAAVPHDPPPRSPRNPDCAAVCPHPFTPFIPPIARAPRL